MITLCRSCEHFTLLVGSHRKLTPLKLTVCLCYVVLLGVNIFSHEWTCGAAIIEFVWMSALCTTPRICKKRGAAYTAAVVRYAYIRPCVQHPAYCCSGAICLQSTDLPTPLAFLKAWVTVIIPFNLMFYYKVHSMISWYVAKELKHVKGAVVEVWT